MAVDSIIARPTNKVRVMVAEASGCWASELSALDTARPSPSAGPMVPKPVVIPAITIDAAAMIVTSSIELSPLAVCFVVSMVGLCFGFRIADARGGRDVNRCQDAEDVGLHHAGEKTERRHDDREDEGRNSEQDTDNHCPAHHVAEQTDGQGQRARKFADDVKRQHDKRRSHIGLEVVAHSLLLDAEERHGHKHAQRECRRGRERAGRRLVAGNDGAEAGGGDKQEERAQKAEVLLRLTQAYLFDLLLDAGDDDFQKVLPAGTFQADGKSARDEF